MSSIPLKVLAILAVLAVFSAIPAWSCPFIELSLIAAAVVLAVNIWMTW